MFKLAFLAVLTAVSLSSEAACFGSGSMYSCTDNSGNSYNVQKYGNTTNVQGYNSSTGSQWNQTSQTYGNTTYQSGNTNGNQWNQTIQSSPGMTTYSGTDSRGNSFYKTCSQFGCN